MIYLVHFMAFLAFAVHLVGEQEGLLTHRWGLKVRAGRGQATVGRQETRAQ